MARLEIGRYSTNRPTFKFCNGRAGVRIVYMGLWIGLKKRVSFGVKINL